MNRTLSPRGSRIARVGRASASVAGSGGPTRFRVAQIDFPDHLVCHLWNGLVEGTRAYLVAKPWGLRRTPFDGLSRGGVSYAYTTNLRRTASGVAGTETQVMVPSYLVGDEIYAVKVVDTGVDGVVWLDLNLDARWWSKE